MISKKAKYAINALVYLARNRDDKPVRIAQVAESENIPQKFLELILLDLKKAGILGSRRGRGGGYYLRRPPGEVQMVEVMRLMDGPIALLPCVSTHYYERCEECQDEATCGIRRAFMEVREATLRILGEATLAAILEKEGLEV